MISTSISLEKAMNMSLDDYIRESGIYVSPMLQQHQQQRNQTTLETINEDEEMNNTNIKEETVSICEENGSTTFDLRQLLNASSKDANIPNNTDIPAKINSQQWRIIPPNIVQNRPAGMPPLVNAPLSQNTFSNKSNNNNNNRQHRQRNRRRNYNRPRNNQNQQQQNRRSINNMYGGRVTKSGNEFQNQINRQNSRGNNLANDLSIEAYVCDDPPSVHGIEPLVNHAGTKNNEVAVVSENRPNSLINSLDTLKSSTILDSMGSIKLELMPTIAGKLLDLFQRANNSNTEPKYDMKIQKEIHNLQGKPMVYKCPGGEVISSDGPGLQCNMTPASTGVSLNQRFA